ncbi:MAG TPA: MGMT family protein [Rectinemataceae bacterium]|nr:MGMT family protein [Rectinemataceae bacterium]
MGSSKGYPPIVLALERREAIWYGMAMATSEEALVATSTGRIAAAAGVIAREVGSLMAHNPLYPLVPCHRVVGSDYGLVGYRGATEGPDLEDKLERLRAEARGIEDERRVGGPDGILVFPVERVIARVAGRDRGEAGQLSLW